MLLENVKRALAARGLIVYSHTSPQRAARIRAINEVKAERELLLSHVEAEQLINAVEATRNVPGDLVEVGTYRGASARLIRRFAAPAKTLHVCDTFAGLPEPGNDDAEFYKGQFASNLAGVQQYLGRDGVEYHVGIFPDAAPEQMRAMRYSFVHLDVDLYEGTLECLRFFYPRLNRGGILLSHDFGAERAPGVEKAFAEYFSAAGGTYIALSGYQGLTVKLGD